MRIPLPQDSAERSKSHRRLEKILDKLGIAYMSEERFPPYKVDVLLTEFYIGIEVDGPFHNKKYDKVRDEYLLAHYKLPVLRISNKIWQSSSKIEEQVIAFIEEHGFDIIERKTNAASR